MGKIPYLFRRNNVFYFRLIVPKELRAHLNFPQITITLKTQHSDVAIPTALMLASNLKSYFHDVRHGKSIPVERSELVARLSKNIHTQSASSLSSDAWEPLSQQRLKPSSPLLSNVIQDFLSRYNPKNRATLIKLQSTLPILLELIGDKPVNTILQADINDFFDQVQKLPVRRDAKIFNGMSIKEIIAANDGNRCIAEGTFDSTYRACTSLFINWATINYKDQEFPDLTAKGAVYVGDRSHGINKQRALTLTEIKAVFVNPKMKMYAENRKYAHYYWLPLIGLFTGCRINEACQLNPLTDIVQDRATGIHYFHFTDEGDAADGVKKSIKTNSSKRVVPIHSKLVELGFLSYVTQIKSRNHKILFPEWSPRNGKASTNASRWFMRRSGPIGLNRKSMI